MSSEPKNICTPLPSGFGTKAASSEQREEYVVKFLENALPSCDVNEINDVLKKDFILDKHKGKFNKKKCEKNYIKLRKNITFLKHQTDIHYEDMLPLNSLWLGYMLNGIGKIVPPSLSPQCEKICQQMIKAEYIGAKISITRSKCPSYYGLEGIIILDTKCTFKIISKDNVIRSIPKSSCVFKVHFGKFNLEVFGKDLCIRPAERCVKKFKTFNIPKL
ncbi:ribonuclease P protein subunit p29 [Trichogramma pretiosum]|uniref:ribonuclease P protein subunit p29 n=1 Tax=Trichogramma pretiosum TaxID=7493 RepID=UPI0006C9D01E|nr:ribonuclease P protein subunit p29 [Trichogramma pretiosum]